MAFKMSDDARTTLEHKTLESNKSVNFLTKRRLMSWVRVSWSRMGGAVCEDLVVRSAPAATRPRRHGRRERGWLRNGPAVEHTPVDPRRLLGLPVAHAKC